MAAYMGTKREGQWQLWVGESVLLVDWNPYTRGIAFKHIDGLNLC